MQPISVPPVAEHYRAADVALFPAADNQVLAYARAAHDPQLLRADIAELLIQCREFRTLDEHIQSYLRGRQASPAAVRGMRRTLQQLAERGYLISRRATLERLSTATAPATPSRIAAIGFPTCERVATLERAITSFVEHGRRFGRSSDVIVMDDSRTPATQRDYREMLAQLQTRHGLRCAYAGQAEKRAFIDRLCAGGELPRAVVEFVCLGSPEYGVTTVGANRNALLLHSVGDLIFSADDDMVCRVAAAPDALPGLRLSSRRNPLDVWFYADRAAALAASAAVDQDLLGLHEQWLGADVRASLGAAAAADSLDIDEADPRLLRRLEQHGGRVVVTLNGSLGDCSWDNPHFYLFQRGATYTRLTSSEQAYRAAQASREMVQAAAQVTLVEHADPMLAMCMGLDHRELLPPFTPVARGEEVGFGAALSQCFVGAYAAHLPRTLLHAPVDPRGFSEQAMFGLGLTELIPTLINQFDPGFARSASERLRKLGRHIEELGQLPPESFAELLRLLLMENMSALIDGLEQRLSRRDEPPPAFWVQHARAVIARASQNAVAPLEQCYTLPGGQAALQGLLLRYGQALQWWPAIVESARELRAQGQRLAQPV